MNSGAGTLAAFAQRRPSSPPYPQSTLLDQRRSGPELAREQIIFPEHRDFECTFWHVETVINKMAVVLPHSKKPLPRGKKKPAL